VDRVLDIVPLRSLVAIADTGGVHRAAASLRMAQSSVSQHVRRLERVLGTPIVTPDGRGVRFTAEGAALVVEARSILAAHDAALHRLAVGRGPEVVVGVTDHASDQLLPSVMATLAGTFPDLQVSFRFDRTARLVESVERGVVDVAVYVSEATTSPGEPVGRLPLLWCAAPGWTPPAAGRPWPLLAIEEPCAIRRRGLSVLAAHGVPSRVVGEAAYLAGVLGAARAGLGVALVAVLGAPPSGLVERTDLPAVPGIELAAQARQGASPQLVAAVLGALREVLAGTPAGV
jgi:DNA-binding transcriptional LysR family regulator